MFDHSIKVPRLYKISAKYAQEASENGTSIKQLVYEKKHPNVKAVYALVAETLQKSSEIDNLLKRSQILEKEKGLNPWLARILITELLWGKKHLAGESKPVKTVLAYKQVLNAHVSDVASKSDESVKPKDFTPRYVRINILKLSAEDSIDAFRDEGRTLIRFTEKDNYKGFLEKVSSLEEGQFMVDLHLKTLLIFPPRTEFFMHNAYKDGFIMLQDKASCLPAQLLNPPPGSTVLDMCAAPGMKTTQLAAMMNNEGTVYAVEYNQKRFETLNKMLETAGATCIKPINRDVITITEKDCPNIEYILVDPSCSGSGILDRISHTKMEEKMNLLRLEKLAGFQIKILKHALNNFREAKRIVYSTCSLYKQENEEVVKEVLASCRNYKLVPAQKLLNGPWLNFGSPEYGTIGQYCLYARPNTDLTNGFFVAVFERLEGDEINPHLVVNLVEKEGGKKRKRKRKNHEDDVEFVNETRNNQNEDDSGIEEIKEATENSNKKKQKEQKKNAPENVEFVDESGTSQNVDGNGIEEVEEGTKKSKRKHKKQKKNVEENSSVAEVDTSAEIGDTVQDVEEVVTEKKKKKRKKNKNMPK